jgi:hypothetical protein
VCRSHAGLHRAERMLDRLATLAHGLWGCIRAPAPSMKRFIRAPAKSCGNHIARITSSAAFSHSQGQTATSFGFTGTSSLLSKGGHHLARLPWPLRANRRRASRGRPRALLI